MHGSNALLNTFSALDVNALDHKRVTAGIAVPAVFLAAARHTLAGKGWKLGAQDVSEHTQGAYTGATSAAMLHELGCDFCLVGHSERRRYQHESDAQIAAKVDRLVEVGIVPIACIGETLEDRQAQQTEHKVTAQLQALLPSLRRACDSGIRTYIAYEPIWAIGTGVSATPQQAQAVHAHLRHFLESAKLETVELLYGGSVTAQTCASLSAEVDIDGLLVGGASLEVASWQTMLAAAATYVQATIGRQTKKD